MHIGYRFIGKIANLDTLIYSVTQKKTTLDKLLHIILLIHIDSER